MSKFKNMFLGAGLFAAALTANVGTATPPKAQIVHRPPGIETIMGSVTAKTPSAKSTKKTVASVPGAAVDSASGWVHVGDTMKITGLEVIFEGNTGWFNPVRRFALSDTFEWPSSDAVFKLVCTDKTDTLMSPFVCMYPMGIGTTDTEAAYTKNYGCFDLSVSGFVVGNDSIFATVTHGGPDTTAAELYSAPHATLMTGNSMQLQGNLVRLDSVVAIPETGGEACAHLTIGNTPFWVHMGDYVCAGSAVYLVAAVGIIPRPISDTSAATTMSGFNPADTTDSTTAQPMFFPYGCWATGFTCVGDTYTAYSANGDTILGRTITYGVVPNDSVPATAVLGATGKPSDSAGAIVELIAFPGKDTTFTMGSFGNCPWDSNCWADSGSKMRFTRFAFPSAPDTVWDLTYTVAVGPGPSDSTDTSSADILSIPLIPCLGTTEDTATIMIDRVPYLLTIYPATNSNVATLTQETSVSARKGVKQAKAPPKFLTQLGSLYQFGFADQKFHDVRIVSLNGELLRTLKLRNGDAVKFGLVHGTYVVSTAGVPASLIHL